MTASTVTSVPEELIRTVAAHGQSVAAQDNAAVLADFLPDRVGQLVASAHVPTPLKSATVRSITDVGGGFFDAVIRYTQPDDSWFELRSRWVRDASGVWRTFSVRNIPDTPPWMDLTGPSADGLDLPHWEGLRSGRLLMQRCAACATWVWSPRPICPQCHNFEMDWLPVPATGTIYSWTRTWQPFTPESSGHLPYVVVLVELSGAGGRRLMGILAHADGIVPQIGTPVRGEIEQPPDDDHWPLIRWHLEGAPS